MDPVGMFRCYCAANNFPIGGLRLWAIFEQLKMLQLKRWKSQP